MLHVFKISTISKSLAGREYTDPIFVCGDWTMSANLYATTNNRCVSFNLLKYFQNLREYNLSLNKKWTFDTNLGYFIFYLSVFQKYF